MMNKSIIANGMMILMASILIVDMANAKKDKDKKKDEKDDKISKCIEQQWGTDRWEWNTCKKDDKQCVRMTCDGKDVRACYDDDDVCKKDDEKADFVKNYASGIDISKCTNCHTCKGRKDKDGENCNDALGGGAGWVTILAGLAMALWMAAAQ